MKTILIIGAGQAGGRAAMTLREAGFSGRIVLAGDEAERPYERPPLSKQVLTAPDDATCFDAWLHPQSMYDEQRVEWCHERVCALDLDAHHATFASGELLRWDACLFATGGSARTLPMLDGHPHVVTLRTLADAMHLRERLSRTRRLVIVGGGFLGLEVAASARQRNLEVTVIEAADALLQRALPQHFARRLQEKHEAHGVAFRLGATLAASTTNGEHIALTLAGGELIDADLCLVAIGQRPNDALARAAGLATDNGIVVDAHCRTSHADVYAAGDCTNFPLHPDGSRVRLESWQNAQEQAAVAARNLLGERTMYRVTPWFWTDQFDWNIQMLGAPGATVDTWVERRTSADRTLLMGLRGPVITQAIAVNSGGDLRAIRRLVDEAVPVDREALTNPAIKLRQIERLPDLERL